MPILGHGNQQWGFVLRAASSPLVTAFCSSILQMSHAATTLMRSASAAFPLLLPIIHPWCCPVLFSSLLGNRNSSCEGLGARHSVPSNRELHGPDPAAHPRLAAAPCVAEPGQKLLLTPAAGDLIIISLACTAPRGVVQLQV